MTKAPWFTTLEFSVTGLCNRTCEFCPRADPSVYPNRNEHLELGLYEKIVQELGSRGYASNVVYSGFGEPTLNKKLPTFIQLTRQHCPDSFIEVKTDGDFLDVEKVTLLFEMGLSRLNVSVYDGPDHMDRFAEMRREAGIDDQRFIMRGRFLPQSKNFGLILSNRAGMVKPSIVPPLKEPLERNCYYPFYIVMVDHKGDVLLCPHDWGKKLIVGNLHTMTLAEAWNSPVMHHVRERLSSKVRDFGPCDVCSVNGLLEGKEQFEAWEQRRAAEERT